MNYTANRQEGRFIKFFNQLRTVCFGSNGDSLSYGPNKQVTVVKLMNNYSNNKLHDSHGFKKEVKIKYNALKVIASKFPNGTAAMIALLVAAAPAIDWARYCGLTPAKQLVWEERGDELNKAMLYLMNSKNQHVKKGIRSDLFPKTLDYLSTHNL